MSSSSRIHNRLQSSPVLESRMHRNSLPTVPESPIQVTSSTLTQATSSLDTSSSTSTGVLSKWSQLAWKLRRHEILHGRSCVIEVLVSRSFRNILGKGILNSQKISAESLRALINSGYWVGRINTARIYL